MADRNLRLLAHRGLYHTFDPEGVDDDTCTAERINPVEHEFIENTIPSMQAAFDLGAEVVEIDIAPSSDGVLVVFHDWTVDCRTNGTGAVRSLTWDELSQLDIGYGYTSDGETFPLRGQEPGLIPRLEEVFDTFPDGQFLINFKSDDVGEAELLHAVVEEADAAGQVWAVYGGQGAVDAYVSRSGARGFTTTSAITCFTLAVTSTLETGGECSDSVVFLPSTSIELLPDGRDQFMQTMADLNNHIVVVDVGSSGINTLETFEAIPQDLNAFVWTDRIDLLGPDG